MKKLILKPTTLHQGSVLTREQLKKVLGGAGVATSGGGKYKCCYTSSEPGGSGCSECHTYTTTPTCGKNSAGVQGVLTSC